ncbi:MAG: hypothetical protein COA63_013935 [Methylophaga sp.]|nr:hypothetical protein [Methylophaga sp.]
MTQIKAWLVNLDSGKIIPRKFKSYASLSRWKRKQRSNHIPFTDINKTTKTSNNIKISNLLEDK